MSADARLAPRDAEAPDDSRHRVILPRGRVLELDGRGRTFVRVVDPPPGAPTLLLLHGWTATADLNWFTSYESLGRQYGLVAMDHRGHGRGIRAGGSFRLSDCADDANAVLEHLGVEQAIVVGYSMGGPISQLLWRRHPDRVTGAVLCATSATFNTSSREKALFTGVRGIAMAARVMPKPLREFTGLRLLTGRSGHDLRQWAYDELSRHDWLQLVQAGREIGSFDSRRWIRSIDVPVSLVITTQDEVVATRRQLALAGMIPDARTFEVDGPHSACVSQPAEFTAALLNALESVRSRLPS
ncbi:MAG: alpha/beta hydrolase [Actinomycetota bacterium]|nr:alpha/beta hydrolase [Actinomycetota bacterium]